MNILKLINDYRQKKRIEKGLLRLSVIILNFERGNLVIVRAKLKLFKELDTTESISKMKEYVLWQKENFEYLATLSYLVGKTKREREVIQITGSVIKPLEVMIIEGRKLIDSLSSVFNSQISCLGSLKDITIKKKELRELFNQEFAFYKEYEKRREEIPAATKATLEAYYDLMSGALQQRGLKQKLLRLEVLAPLMMAIVLSCEYLVIDDPAIREEISDPKFIALIGGTTYGFSKFMVELMKIVNYVEIMKKKKKPS